MNLTNKLHLPDSIVQAVKNDPYSSEGSDISCTTLIGPPRIRVLKARYGSEITEDVSERLWSLYGQAAHYILERSGGAGAQETRLFAKVSGWTLSGQFDNIENEILSDYKMTSIWAVKKGVKPEWENQLNVLAWLAAVNGIAVSKIQIIALLKDWRRTETLRVEDYPKVPLKVVPVPLWSMKKREEYVYARISLHQVAELVVDNELPLCTDEERWCVPGKFAVMKGKNIKAVRLLATQEEAEKYIIDKNITGGHVVERPTKYNRCADYCNVNNRCNQFREG